MPIAVNRFRSGSGFCARKKLFKPLVVAFAMHMGWPSHARAQTSAPPSRASPQTLAGVTVTEDADGSKTEGTGSYTTEQTGAATRLLLSPQQTPQSITVVTRQRMDDQRLDSVQDVLENASGISSQTLDSDRVSFYARGFQVDSFQYDGIPTAFLEGASFLDTAFYDRVEVVRGATGLLTGAGNPSASVNLVRKRPTRDFSASGSISGGTWENFRESLDISNPLTEDGRVRSRAVGVYDDGHSYIDRYQRKKKAFYGVIEADLTEKTTLSVGYDDQDITPSDTTWGGLPIWFSDGSRTHWSRSKALASTDWSRWGNTLKNAFAQLEYRLDNGWVARAVLNQQRTDSDYRLFSALGYPDRNTGLGLLPVMLGGDTRTRQNSLDAMANGSFEAFGRQHEGVVGIMASNRTSDGISTYPVMGASAMTSAYDWRGHYPEADFAAAPQGVTDSKIKQGGLYGAARLSLSDPLTMIIGGRFNNYEIHNDSAGSLSKYKTSGKFTPYAGLVYDFDPTYAAYASYTEIFNPQISYQDREGKVLEPTTGENREVGLKGNYLGGKLTASVAIFDTRLNGVAQIDPGHLTATGAQAYYAASGTRSRGIDIDVEGALSRGWNVYAGASHFTASDATGARLSTQLPRTTARLFSTYRLPGNWSRVTVGGGLNWQSRFYMPEVSPFGPAIVQQKSYAIASFMTRFEMTSRLDLALNVNNLFDKRYSAMMGFFNDVTFGAPRDTVATITYRL